MNTEIIIKHDYIAAGIPGGKVKEKCCSTCHSALVRTLRDEKNLFRSQYEEEVTVMGLNTVIPQFIRHKNVAI
jgi:hypothetical protein